jgi:hypothetical protein
MTAAAFKASYAEWKVIKTRACVQLVFELPIEKADEAYQALGGMPIAAREVWCAIARLEEKGLVQYGQIKAAVSETTQPPSPTVSRIGAGEAERRKFSDMSPAQQAGILCNERPFQLFLSEKFGHLSEDAAYENESEAADCVRELCNVKSRADLTADNAEWLSLVLAYRLWQREPEFV